MEFRTGFLTDDMLRRLSSLEKLEVIWPPTDETRTRFVLTDSGLNGASSLTELDMGGLCEITGEGITGLTNLTKLVLCSNLDWTCFLPLTRLKSLQVCFGYACSLADAHLSHLNGLTALSIGSSSQVRGDFLTTLTNLASLNPGRQTRLTDNDLKKMTSLTELHLPSTNAFTNAGVSSLINLTWLDVSENLAITDSAISHLVKLVYLDLSFNTTISDHGISGLSSLATLLLRCNGSMTDAGLMPLAGSLTSLGLGGHYSITDSAVSTLTNLIQLDLEYYSEWNSWLVIAFNSDTLVESCDR